MFYKKFKTDDNDCISVQTFSLLSNSKEILLSQLITDGDIDDKNTIISKKEICDVKFDYLDSDIIEKINQYSNDCDFGIVKEVKVAHPSYCMFTIYRFDGENWILCGRTIISNKENKLFYDFIINNNIPYIESDYISSTKPNDGIANQKILKREKLSEKR